MQADVFFQNDPTPPFKVSVSVRGGFLLNQTETGRQWLGKSVQRCSLGSPCARLDATLGHRGFTNLGTLASVREGKFERSPDGLKILESCLERERWRWKCTKWWRSLTTRPLSVLRMLRMRVVQKETRYFRALHATTSQPFNLEPLGEEWVQAQGMVEHCSWCLVDFTCDENS